MRSMMVLPAKCQEVINRKLWPIKFNNTYLLTYLAQLRCVSDTGILEHHKFEEVLLPYTSRDIKYNSFVCRKAFRIAFRALFTISWADLKI